MGQDGDFSNSGSACSSYHPHPAVAGEGLEGILAAIGLSLGHSSKERYFFILYTETTLRTAGEEEEVQ